MCIRHGKREHQGGRKRSVKVKMRILVPNTYPYQPHMHKISHIQYTMSHIRYKTLRSHFKTSLFVCLCALFVDFQVHFTTIVHMCTSNTSYKLLILPDTNVVIIPCTHILVSVYVLRPHIGLCAHTHTSFTHSVGFLTTKRSCTVHATYKLIAYAGTMCAKSHY